MSVPDKSNPISKLNMKNNFTVQAERI
jgi:hypothetical protein